MFLCDLRKYFYVHKIFFFKILWHSLGCPLLSSMPRVITFFSLIFAIFRIYLHFFKGNWVVGCPHAGCPGPLPLSARHWLFNNSLSFHEQLLQENMKCYLRYMYKHRWRLGSRIWGTLGKDFELWGSDEKMHQSSISPPSGVRRRWGLNKTSPDPSIPAVVHRFSHVHSLCR